MEPKPLVQILTCLALALLTASEASARDDTPVLWDEIERLFYLDGPAYLMSEEERRNLLVTDSSERRRLIDSFLARDPVPETPVNELVEGISKRRELVLAEVATFLDERGRALFLHGVPAERTVVECGATFVPLEVWTYPPEVFERRLVFYEPSPGQPYRLWIPLDSKRVLYTSEMEYWLEQYEELRGRIRSKRFDLLTCSETKLIDQVTGVRGLTGYRDGRPTAQELWALFEPPADLAAWARKAIAVPTTEPTDVSSKEETLEIEDVAILFPERFRQRLVARFVLVLPENVELGTSTEEGRSEHVVAVDGVVEEGDGVLERFRIRFRLPAEPGRPLALALERRLRPGREYLVRLHVVDEVDGGGVRLSRGFRVPLVPQAVEEPPVPEDAIVAIGEQLAAKRLPGKDSLLLVPPEVDIVLGVWRAEALVSGESIKKVVFLVDGEVQLTRTRAPYSAEVRLAQFPTEQIIRAEGYDESGQLIAADEVVINQPRGAFKVRILEPARGAAVGRRLKARAEVVVPDERRVVKVEFFLNDALAATLERVPWQTMIEIPASEEMSYLTVVATLDDGQRSEQVRFLNAPQYLEEVDVNLVEVLTTVLDRSKRPVRGLARREFEVLEDGQPQTIEKFERVEDLPITVGFAIDTSGSMEMALPEARRAAVGFLENLITPRDKIFAVGFAGEPVLLIPPTDDIRAVEGSLDSLRSVGWTALHDALVHSLYYFRGARGRKALILLSDGDDSASFYPFRDALEYARRSGVVIYTVGIGVKGLKMTIRRKLGQLAEETGGRAFFIGKAEELAGVYGLIEEELRSQYLLTYSSKNTAPPEAFRSIEVRVRQGKLEARATRGYYPG